MPFELVSVQNAEAWGKLVKTWATGVNYFAPDTYPGGALTPPTSLAELNAQCTWAKVQINIPARITGCRPVYNLNPNEFVINLPVPALIKEGENFVKTNSYPLPEFYSRLAFGGVPPNVTDPDRFHHCRIGDYVIGQCW